MDRISRLFVRRLRHLARREALRIALRNGLLDCKLVEAGGHVLYHYSPAFDTGSLTGDAVRDRVWFRRHFGVGLVAPKEPTNQSSSIGEDVFVTGEPLESRPAAPLVAFPRMRRGSVAQVALLCNGVDRRSYAVGLVGAAGDPPLVCHVVAALALARAVTRSTRSLRDIVRTITHATPVVTLHAPLEGFEREVLRLLEKSRFVPGGPFATINVDHVLHDDHFDVHEGGSRRRIVVFQGEGVHRGTGKSLRRRMTSALARDFPIVGIAEKRSDIPAMLQISADVSLEVGRFDRAFVGDLVEAFYPGTAIDAIDLPADSDARWLSLEDLILAFRPGRELADVFSVLAVLIERNREDAQGEDGEEEDANAGDTAPASGSKSSASKLSDKVTERTGGAGETSKLKASESDTNGRWKRDKPSGAEVIQPELLALDGKTGHKPPLTVETLSGYGKAKEWALDLKADLDEYRVRALAWSEMSTKLLLSGPPGTGKTTFARALCNSLQIPLVVTSVSTWLQGGHLNDVIDKMSKTFIEARALAPSILFIDEIDGIGKRQPAEREYADYWNAVVNKVLELMDGAVKSEGLIIVGATNRPDEIDEAIKRSGRLETHIEIPKPDAATLADILAHHLGDDVRSLIREADPDARLEPTDRSSDDEPWRDEDPLVPNTHRDDAPGTEEALGEAAIGREGASR